MAIDGLLILDKPSGPTSHDIVQRVRRLFGQRRVGHGGTLDPMATGVLIVALGQATRFLPHLPIGMKTYEGTIRLGLATETYDAWGPPVGEECRTFPEREAVASAMRGFEGRILQTPPPFSAKKVGGRPAYALARDGRKVRLKPVRVTVESFRLRTYRPPEIEFEVRCTAGTYIRSLAHDLGRVLGCGAHLASLRRTAAGGYAVGQALTLDALEQAATDGRAEALVIPLERLLPEAPSAVVNPQAEARVRSGAPIGPDHLALRASGVPMAPLPEGPIVRLFDRSGRLLALARPSPARDRLLPFLVVV